MKRSKFLEIKSKKPIEFNDLFLYTAAFVAVLVLFIVFVFLGDGKANYGFTITKDQKTVCSFTYSNESMTINDHFKDLVNVEKNDNGYLITVFTSQDKLDYNVIFVDTSSRTVKVRDSTCSISKDCVYSPAIGEDGAIYCAPHGLKILPDNSSGRIPPITG